MHWGGQPHVDAEPGDVVDLFVEHLGGQTERGDVRAHETAGTIERLEDHAFVPHGREIVGNRERSAAGADQRDAPPILLRCGSRQPVFDVAAIIGCDALQTANRNRLLFDAPASARRLTRPIAHASEDAGEHIGLAIQQVRVAEPPLRHETDVLGNIGVRRTCPLAIYNAVKVFSPVGVGRIHQAAKTVRSTNDFAWGFGGAPL